MTLKKELAYDDILGAQWLNTAPFCASAHAGTKARVPRVNMA